MSDLLVSEGDMEPKLSVRATVRNFEKIVDNNSANSPPVTRGNNSPDTRPRQIHKLKFLGDHKSFESSSSPDIMGGDHEVKEGVEDIVHKTLAERLEALQSSSTRAFETSRSAKINAQPISRIRESLRQSVDNLQQMIILRPPDIGVRTVTDIRDAIRKSKENLNDDDDCLSKSDEQLQVCESHEIVNKPSALPRPAPRRSKMLKLVANRSQSCENLLAGNDELVAMTSPPKTTKSFTKADCVENIRAIAEVKTDSAIAVRSKSDVQSSIRRASYRAAEQMELADKPVNKLKTNVLIKTGQTEHLSPEGDHPAEIFDNQLGDSPSESEKSDMRSGGEQNESVETSPDKLSTESDNLHSVDLIQPIQADETENSSAAANDAELFPTSNDQLCPTSNDELCPTSNDVNDSSIEKSTHRASPSCNDILVDVSLRERGSENKIRKFASVENITSSCREQISYDPTADIELILPLLSPIHEEVEYDLLSEIFVENILDEQRKFSVIISPPKDSKTTVDYVYPLFNMSCTSNTELTTKRNEEQEFTDFESMKDVLLSRAAAKLEALTVARHSLTMKIEELKQVESELDALVKTKADERQFGKYRVCVEEMEKVVHLLLMLSGRLARLHNNILCLQVGGDEGEEEAAQQHKTVLALRYKELLQKHEDAASLKESIDHRTRQLAHYLGTCLEPQELHDYQRFVATKSRFHLARQSLEDRASQAEEQIKAISECRAGEVFVNFGSTTDTGGASRETDV